jgi:hypothetical protein
VHPRSRLAALHRQHNLDAGRSRFRRRVVEIGTRNPATGWVRCWLYWLAGPKTSTVAPSGTSSTAKAISDECTAKPSTSLKKANVAVYSVVRVPTHASESTRMIALPLEIQRPSTRAAPAPLLEAGLTPFNWCRMAARARRRAGAPHLAPLSKQ